MLDFDQKFEEDLLGGEGAIPEFTVDETTEKEEHKNTESKGLTKKGKPRQKRSPAVPRKQRAPK